jgi:hypothetical protein
MMNVSDEEESEMVEMVEIDEKEKRKGNLPREEELVQEEEELVQLKIGLGNCRSRMLLGTANWELSRGSKLG